jgi:hypothetical protein
MRSSLSTCLTLYTVSLSRSLVSCRRPCSWFGELCVSWAGLGSIALSSLTNGIIGLGLYIFCAFVRNEPVRIGGIGLSSGDGLRPLAFGLE